MIVIYGLIGFWLVYNLIVMIRYTPEQMYSKHYRKQRKIRKVFCTIFYLPFWVIKFVLYFAYYCCGKCGNVFDKVFFF